MGNGDNKEIDMGVQIMRFIHVIASIIIAGVCFGMWQKDSGAGLSMLAFLAAIYTMLLHRNL